MPFDCARIIDAPDLSTVGNGDLRNLLGASPGAVRTRPIPSWHISRRLGCRAEVLAVLARARAVLSDEQRWCQGRSLGGNLVAFVRMLPCARSKVLSKHV